MRILNSLYRRIRIAILPLEAIKGHYYISRKSGLSKLDAFSNARALAKKASKDSRVLSRPGVVFTEAQKEIIKSLVEAGKKAEAQGVVLVELNKQLGLDENIE